MQNNALKEAIEELKILSRDHDAWDDYTQREKDLRDYIANARAERAEGKAEGEAEGEARGIVKGTTQTLLKVALAMKLEKAPMSLIMKVSGLTKEEIEKL